MQRLHASPSEGLGWPLENHLKAHFPLKWGVFGFGMIVAMVRLMRKIMEHLLEIQNQQLSGEWLSASVLDDMAKHRAQVPPPVFAHFERLLARGKNGVATVLDGVCTECHLRISRGKLASLVADQDICLCDNCGRYLYLPVSEHPAARAGLHSSPFPRGMTPQNAVAKMRQ